MDTLFNQRMNDITTAYENLITRKNEPILPGNGILERYKYPILTADHTAVFWSYDMSPETNPYFMERFGIGCTFNAGAIKWNTSTC